MDRCHCGRIRGARHSCAAGLIASGITLGDRVAIMASTRYENQDRARRAVHPRRLRRRASRDTTRALLQRHRPAPLENALRAHPLINQAMVLGDARPFVSALITLDSTALRAWRERRGLPQEVSVSDLQLVHGLHAEIDGAVSKTNKMVLKAEQIKQFRILDTEWTQSAGELTPKLSIKRDVVLAHYASDVEAIYA